MSHREEIHAIAADIKAGKVRDANDLRDTLRTVAKATGCSVSYLATRVTALVENHSH
jgi:hypothetical protein